MVELVISRYTREAGVRNLERHIAALARAAAVKVAEKQQQQHQSAHSMQQPQAIDQGQAASAAGLGDSGEVELVVEADGHGREVAHASVDMEPLLVDEAVLETVLGVCFSPYPINWSEATIPM